MTRSVRQRYGLWQVKERHGVDLPLPDLGFKYDQGVDLPLLDLDFKQDQGMGRPLLDLSLK